MKAKLPGVNTVRKRLSSGGVGIYYYYRPTGARLTGKPGSAEFALSYAQAAAAPKANHVSRTLAGLMNQYSHSQHFKKQLAKRTQKEYVRKIRSLENEFGDLPVKALDNRRVRRHFIEYGERVAEISGPREADYRLSVLSSCLSWAADAAIIETNHLLGFKRYYHGDRSSIIWEPTHIDAFMRLAPFEMQRALVLALHTGLRQGDLLGLQWSNYDGHTLRLRIGKNGKNGQLAPVVVIPCTKALRGMLDDSERRGSYVLSIRSGEKYSARHFGKQWKAAFNLAGLEGSDLHFNDLRGTAVTLLSAAGCTIPQICGITKHKLETATKILEKYLDTTRYLAEQAIELFENASATEFANQLQTVSRKAQTKGSF
ncbi:MAG: integrase [Alphaproteobacteria bacterium PA2]|nr:MAG: integrase [Alphaproteobacteria bacterium PA2]